jgi:5-methyltetrahydrofolate--homocysteine methyltransferase
MPRTDGKHPFLVALSQRVLVFDGSMGATLQAMNLTAADFGGKEGCNDHLSLTRPDAVRALHRAFLEAGADALETNTFQASRLKLDEYGLGETTREHNVVSAQLARELADDYTARDPSKPRFVVGSLGPTGMLPSANDPSLSKLTYADLYAVYHEQAAALLEGGVDALLVETQQDILETRAAVTACARAAAAHAEATGRPRAGVMASVSLDTQGRMLLGTDIAAVNAILEALPCDVVGVNCSTGPEYMRDAVRYLANHSSKYISCIPNAGIPRNDGGIAIYPLEPEGMRDHLRAFVDEFGVNVVGGCCGTGPEHIRLLVESTAALPPRTPKAHPSQEIASGMTSLALEQEPRPLIVGERLNAQGSRKVKRLILSDDYDALVQVAREQVAGGAHALDVCMALTEREGEDTAMAEVVKRLELSVEAPLMIDSTEARVIKRALETNPGRAIINSVNLENGRSRIDDVLPLAVEHGAAVVALTIEKSVGMAKTVDDKVLVARQIESMCCGEFGLPRGRLIFDVLTFTLATGQPEYLDAGVNTIEGIRAVKAALPGVLTVLGVSNISFGLNPAARAVINSVFLYHCVEAGLDLAIVNPKDITPYALIMQDERTLVEDLIFNRNPEALQRVIARYEGVSAASTAAVDDDDSHLPVNERIHRRILHRKKEGIEALLDEALKTQSPVEVLNGVLLGAMKDVGDKFGAGELILPFVLQSAEVMKKAVSHVEQFLEKNDSYTKGVVVLATVFGDVHDIGKNLVHTILSNNGYTVHDLGKQVPVHSIIEKAIAVNADAIGLSALLVSTSKQTPLSGHRRWRSDQPRVRPAHRLCRARDVLRARRFLREGRLRGPRADGLVAGSGAARGSSNEHRGRRTSRGGQTRRARCDSGGRRPARAVFGSQGFADSKAAVLGCARIARHQSSRCVPDARCAFSVSFAVGREKCERRCVARVAARRIPASLRAHEKRSARDRVAAAARDLRLLSRRGRWRRTRRVPAQRPGYRARKVCISATADVAEALHQRLLPGSR